ncbi:CLAVATA3/ESR (CLE)-related protein 5-like [Manihot esculenta]|uniref:Uncharacterized protein n=2 Tax=Manihot esculenta TaxID=3983 RepID=A0ACB7GA79_MANES|nr:CLAVATA3/ESR (CLE)-related protein 5-like [Manihot esculenta]KAG8637172.1 hypothetical protein MANES_15G091400v8 [Manihot esculenta]
MHKRCMATLKPSLVLVFIVVTTLMLVASAEAPLPHHESSFIPRKMDSGRILRELGYDGSRLEHHRMRFMQGADPQRESPGGPDPQHH